MIQEIIGHRKGMFSIYCGLVFPWIFAGEIVSLHDTAYVILTNM